MANAPESHDFRTQYIAQPMDGCRYRWSAYETATARVYYSCPARTAMNMKGKSH
ncbi:hypothetical protein GCM10027565_36580 [Bordetella tumulicola]